MDRNDFDRIHSVRNDGQGCQTAINLEGLTDAELEVAAKHPALHSDVAAIASKLLFARAMRLEGKIALAVRVEGDCDRIYEMLPAALRW
jgi:hypothetical protein